MTELVAVPAAPVVPPFPALGDPAFNQLSYTWGAALPGVSGEVQAIAVAAHTNATVAKEKAAAAVATAAQAVTDTNAIKTAAVNETTAIKTAAVNETTAIKNAAAISASEALSSKGAAAISAGEALASANASALSADQSEASRIAASKLNLGSKAAPPTLDNQGEALTAGTTYYDITLDRWRVWTGVAWGEGVSAVAGVSSINGLTGDVMLPPPQFVAYGNRANLRSQTPASGELAIVDGLGLFVFVLASDEPDDDESCFATATGRWLLECPHWDVVADWQLPDDAARDEAIESLGRILRATVACPVTSVAAVSQAAFTAVVPGAVETATVLATPLAALDARLAVSARISAANTVTVTLNNPSAAVTAASGIPANWQITVFKEI